MATLFHGDVQGTSNMAYFVCDVCGHQWIASAVLKCELCTLRADNAALRERLARLVGAAITFQREAVVLSEEYLEAFKDWKEDACIQGWEKARWKRALTARKNLTQAIDAAESGKEESRG